MSHRYLELRHLFTLSYVCIVFISQHKSVQRQGGGSSAFDMDGFGAQAAFRVHVKSDFYLYLLRQLSLHSKFDRQL